ncbi:hypothetical protein AB0I61_34555 [Polymorphospora rubra]|uniref:hypothetical protein n=1 Tax=Polymorphospora rubra TaxID=338584 RepID=UPI00340DB4B7
MLLTVMLTFVSWGVVLNYLETTLGNWARPAQTATQFAVAVVVGVLSYRIGRRGSRRSLAVIATTVVGPITLEWLLLSRAAPLGEVARGVLLALPGIAVGVVVAGRLAGAGRIRAAWTAGVSFALFGLWLGTMVLFLPIGSHPEIDYAMAPIWLPHMLLGSAVVPLDAVPAAEVVDHLALVPEMAVATAAYALGYAVGGSRPDRTGETGSLVDGATS